MEKFSNTEAKLKKKALLIKKCILNFAMVLRGIHRKVDICQTNYSTNPKLRIFSYSDAIHGSTTFKLTKVKEKRINY